VLSLAGGDPAEDHGVAALVRSRPVLRAVGQRGGQMDVADRMVTQGRRRPPQLGRGHPVDPDPRPGVQARVEGRVLAQVPVQRVQHRRHGRVQNGRGQHGQPHHLDVVVHQVDVVPVPERAQHRVLMSVGHAGHLVVGALKHLELPAGERRQPLVRGQGAAGHRGQHHPDAPLPQRRDQGGDHILNASVPVRRHRQPRPGVDQHGPGHAGTGPVMRDLSGRPAAAGPRRPAAAARRC
jgi:hypothetical protein